MNRSVTRLGNGAYKLLMASGVCTVGSSMTHSRHRINIAFTCRASSAHPHPFDQEQMSSGIIRDRYRGYRRTANPDPMNRASIVRL